MRSRLARRWPLAATLTAIVTALLAVSVATVTVVSFQQTKSTLRSELTNEADRMLSALSASWLDPIIKLDVDYLQDAMEGLEDDESVLDVRVYDAAGRLIARIETERTAAETSAPGSVEISDLGLEYALATEQTTVWESDRLHVARPVRIGSQGFGAITVELSTASLAAESAAARFRSILLGLVVIGVGAAATLILSRTITGPLRDLTVTAEVIAGGNLDQQVPVRGGDEVSRLTLTFNEMVDQIRDTLGKVEGERSRFESIAEGLSVGLMIVDDEDLVTYVNGSFERILGLASGSLVGRAIDEVSQHFEVDPRSNAGELDDRPFSSVDATTAFDLRVGSRLVAVGGFTVADERAGSQRGYIFTDVTEARQVDRMKSEFVAIASHELRTPLTGMLGFAGMLAESEDLAGQEHSWALRIQQESARLANIVTDLLNVSKIESGDVDVVDESVAIGAVIEGVLGTFGQASGTHELSTAGTIDARVRGDPAKLTEVLGNLVDNAIKYSPDGGKVVIRCVPGPDVVQVSVEDQGLGVPAAELENLFSRFHRIARPDYDGIRSTGLGLYLVRQYIERMGGAVEVESVEGVGSTFRFSVPLDRESANAPASAA